MATIFDANVPILNVPAYYLYVPALIIIIAYLLLTRKPKPTEYKPIDMKKEIKNSFKDLYQKFGIAIGKPMYRDIIEIGFIIGYYPMMWNKKIKVKDNISIANVKEVQDAMQQVREQPEIQEIVSEADITINKNPFSKHKDKIITDITEMYVYKFCNNSLISKFLAKLLGIGINFMVVESDYVTNLDDRLIIKITAQPTRFYGIYIFSKTARHYIENISFRTNRENELQEIANTVPRAVFFDTQLAKWVARARENAMIEKEKYKGQIEAGEEA